MALGFDLVRQWRKSSVLSVVAGFGVLAAVQCSNGNNGSGSGGGPMTTTDAATTSCTTDGMAPPIEASSNDAPSQDAGQPADAGADAADPVKAAATALIDQGRQTFRYATFGDEAFWGGSLKLHEAIEGSGYDGGVGPGVSPQTALSVGLKIDVDALPASVVTAIQQGKLDLTSPATTLAALQLNAVVGVTGIFDANKNLESIGIQCALCHSTVDDSLTKGIGHRLDGWANRDLNVGAIVNLAPDLSAVAAVLGVPEATVRTVLQSWGPGKFDAELFMDGRAFNPDGGSGATLIPPAFGLAGVNMHTSTGWGSVTYWNAFVANLEMHGSGTFFDPRLDDAGQFPVAAANNFGHVSNANDAVTPTLGALQFYQLALLPPPPPPGSFDPKAATRGQSVFDGPGKCASCHVPPLFTEPGWNMHTPQDIGIDGFQASRSPDGRYRTAPLRGVWSHATGGYYHDGRFATLAAVVAHYDTTFNLGLSAAQQSDLVQYLLSL